MRNRRALGDYEPEGGCTPAGDFINELAAPTSPCTGRQGTYYTFVQRGDSDPVEQCGDSAEKTGQEVKQLVFSRKSAKSLLVKEPEEGAGAQRSFLLVRLFNRRGGQRELKAGQLVMRGKPPLCGKCDQLPLVHPQHWQERKGN